MKRKYIIIIIIPSLILHLAGCYSMQNITKEELSKEKEKGDIEVYTKSGSIYSYEKSKYYISNDSIYGTGYVKFSADADYKVEVQNTLPMDNVKKIQQSELNYANTWLTIGAGAVLLAVTIYTIILFNELSNI